MQERDAVLAGDARRQGHARAALAPFAQRRLYPLDVERLDALVVGQRDSRVVVVDPALQRLDKEVRHVLYLPRYRAPAERTTAPALILLHSKIRGLRKELPQL